MNNKIKKGLCAFAVSCVALAAAMPAWSDATTPAPAGTTPAKTQVASNTVDPSAPKSEPEYGKKAGDIMVRLRGLYVRPSSDGDIDPIGGTPHISNVVVPEVDFSYFLTDYLALELIAATTKHNVSAHGTAAGDVDLGSVWMLPPTLTLQVHPFPKARFSPYIGGGINYTFFYGAHAPDSGPVQKIHYTNSIGYAAQIGMDVRLDGNWYLNADVKYLWLNNHVSINGGSIKAKVNENPLIVGVGFGYKF